MVIVGGVEILLYMLLCYCIGRLIIAALGIPVDGLVRAGGPLIGAGAMAVPLWLYGVVHVPLLFVLLIAPWVVLAVVWRKVVIVAARDDAAGLRGMVTGLRDLDA